MDFEPLLGLMGLLFVKEAGIPIPIPGDLLVLGAGVAAAADGALAPLDLGAILLAGFAGGSLQFVLVRGALRGPLLALLARIGVPRDRLDRLADWLRRRGARGVAIARATPGLRIGTISASGLAALQFPTFLGGLVVGNSLFVGGHFLLGFAIGAPALELLRSAGGLAAGAAALVVLAITGALGWGWLRGRRARTGSASGTASGTAAIDLLGAGAWADAACPACLALSLVAGDAGDAAVSASA